MIQYKELPGASFGEYNPNTHSITIDPKLPKPIHIITLIHELVHSTYYALNRDTHIDLNTKKGRIIEEAIAYVAQYELGQFYTNSVEFKELLRIIANENLNVVPKSEISYVIQEADRAIKYIITNHFELLYSVSRRR